MFHYLFYLLLRKPYLIQTTAIISQGDMSVRISIGHHLCTKYVDEVKQSA